MMSAMRSMRWSASTRTSANRSSRPTSRGSKPRFSSHSLSDTGAPTLRVAWPKGFQRRFRRSQSW